MSDLNNNTVAQDELAPLFVEENDHYRLTLRLDKQQMECLVEFEIFAAPSKVDEEGIEELYSVIKKPLVTPPDCFWFLQQNNIVQTIDYPAVYDFCAAIEMGMSPESVVLARGIAPQTGADGWFELNVKISGEEIDLQEDEFGNVDHRTLNAYTEIDVGQKLGLVHAPREGIPGMTVHGQSVVAEPGKPYELKAGDGVKLKYNDRVAFATKSGRAMWDKQTLKVVDLLVISGDVDLAVGNIDFNGFVEIKGEVGDDFSVRGTEGIKISGFVGACQIESDGAVQMLSMAGKEVGQITCRGELRANFLNQVTVFCYGDVIISSEIRNCVIKATGKISVEHGAIIGGKCVALAGIEAKTIGTRSGQKTQLHAGIYFPDADRFTYLRNRMKHIDSHICSIVDVVKPLQQLLKKGSLAEAAKQRMTILNEQLLKVKVEKQQISAEIKASTPQQPLGMNPKINVQTQLLERVEITLGESSEVTKIERRGPLSIIDNSIDGGLRYLTRSPLSLDAGETEQLLLDAEATESD
ncbi:MAG: FapA family protein [Thermodesulfobacteriota bacterium]|nr:FapA family protein [Thermodesulfobacteriota bacterium]